MNPIVELRRRLNLTQKEFAEKMGVFQQEISRIENGDFTELNARQKYLLIKAFGVSVEWLETGQGDMFPRRSGGVVPDNVDAVSFAFSQGLGRSTALLFGRLCEMTQAQKETVERIASDKRIATLARLFVDNSAE